MKVDLDELERKARAIAEWDEERDLEWLGDYADGWELP